MNQQATLESTDFVHLGDIFDTLIRIPTLIPNNKSILKAKKLNLYIILTNPVCAFFFAYPLIYSKSETYSLVGKNKKFIIFSYEVHSVFTFFLFILNLEKDELPCFFNSTKEFIQGNISLHLQK